MLTQALLQPLVSCGSCSFSCSQRFTRQTSWRHSALRQQCRQSYNTERRGRLLHVVRAEEQGKIETKEEELPPWIRAERERKLQSEEGSDLPFPVYLIGSALVAIAAVSFPAQDILCITSAAHAMRDIAIYMKHLQGVGSIFEYANRNPLFGVVKPDSFLWAPILLFFAITGFPSAGFLFIKAINAANKDAERQDKIDGY